MRGHTASILLAASVALLACEAGRREGADTTRAATPPDSPPAARSGTRGTAALRNSAGKDLGTLRLSESAGRISLTGQLTGLPRGTHAIHLHTVGRCDRPKFESAGDHWNPTGREHGTLNPNGPHLGDLPNLAASQNGSIDVQATTPGGTLQGANPLLDRDGAAVVVHAKRDDYKTQPSGDSGDRIACGVVSGER